jgi:hypothetical protein
MMHRRDPMSTEGADAPPRHGGQTAAPYSPNAVNLPLAHCVRVFSPVSPTPRCHALFHLR